MPSVLKYMLKNLVLLEAKYMSITGIGLLIYLIFCIKTLLGLFCFVGFFFSFKQSFV